MFLQKNSVFHEERKNLRTAALLHDIYKRKEIERARKEGSQSFDETSKEQAEWLRTLGYSREVVELVETVSHSSYEEFTRDFEHISTARKIIQYTDFITLSNDIVPLAKRIKYLEEEPKYEELNESGKNIFGRTYFEVMREIGAKIEKEFAPLLGVSDPSAIPEFIKSCINDRIAQEDKT